MNSKTLGIVAIAAVAILVASTITVYLTPVAFASEDNRGGGGNGGRGGDTVGGVFAGDDARGNDILPKNRFR